MEKIGTTVTNIVHWENLDRLIGVDEDNEVTHKKPSKSQTVEEPLHVGTYSAKFKIHPTLTLNPNPKPKPNPNPNIEMIDSVTPVVWCRISFKTV